MDLQELARRTRIPIRRLRHCLDAGLVPGIRVAAGENEVGRRRQFHEDVGFAICCAARLLGTAVARSTVRKFLAGMAEIQFRDGSKPILPRFLEDGLAGRAELGDGCNMRLELHFRGAVDEAPYDTNWVHPGNPAPLAPEYRPLTIVGLDIGRIRDQVFNRPATGHQAE